MLHGGTATFYQLPDGGYPERGSGAREVTQAGVRPAAHLHRLPRHTGRRAMESAAVARSRAIQRSFRADRQGLAPGPRSGRSNAGSIRRRTGSARRSSAPSGAGRRSSRSLSTSPSSGRTGAAGFLAADSRAADPPVPDEDCVRVRREAARDAAPGRGIPARSASLARQRRFRLQPTLPVRRQSATGPS